MNNKKEPESIDLYTFDYKTYIKEMYNLNESEILIESPARYTSTIHQFDHDLIVNSQIAIKVENNGKNIGDFKIGNNVRYRIFVQPIENGSICYSLLEPDQPVIVVSHTVKEFDGGVESLDIWQSIRNRGLARWWVFDYILKHYKFMVSDKLHTKYGEIFWKSLIGDSLEKKLKTFVVNTKTNEKLPISNISEVDKYYGNNKFEFRFVIEA